jgi:hypothetical protein
MLNSLDSVAVTWKDSDIFSIGPWNCSLSGRTFFIEYISVGPIPLFYRKSGVFVPDARGNWQAVVKEVVQN